MKKITLIILLLLFSKGFSQMANIVAVKTTQSTSYWYVEDYDNQTITYYLQVGNNGVIDAENVSVEVSVPDNIPTAQITWAGNGALGNGNLSDTIALLEIGEIVTYQITIPILEGFNPLTDILTSDNVDVLSDTEDSDVIFLLTKDAYVDGTNLTYTITVTNNGPDNAMNVQVSDIIPEIEGMNINDVTWVGSNGTSGIGNLTNTISVLENGQTVIYTVTLPIPEDYDLPIINSVEITSDTPNGNNVCLGCTNYATPKLPVASIVTTKTTPIPTYSFLGTEYNQTITYYLQVGNNGLVDAQDVNIEALVPENIPNTMVTWTGSNGTSGTGDLLDTIILLETGEIVTYQITIPVLAGFDPITDILTSASVSSITEGSEVVYLLTHGAYIPGTNLVYTITVTNNGDDAENVQVSDIIPEIEGMNINDVAWVGSNGTSGIGNLTNTISVLENGQTVTYTVTLPIPEDYDLSIINSVEITSDTPDGNNVCLGCTNYAVSKLPVANIVTTKTPPTQGYMYQGAGYNQTITYYLQVGNNGADNATDVSVNVPIPGNMPEAQVTWTGSNGTSGTGEIDVVIASLNSGEIVTYQIVMPIVSGFNAATDMLTSGDVTVIGDDDVVFLLTNGAYVPGTAAIYTITVTNDGPDDAENVVVSDVISIPGVNLASVTWTGTNGTSGTGDLEDTIATLANGATVTYTVVIPTPANLTQIITNTVEVTSNTPNDNNVCIGCTSYAAPVAYADLQISKVATNSCYLAGDWLEYIITVSNNGPSNAQNVVVHDPILPLYNSYGIIASQMNWTGSNGSAGSGTLSNTIPTLAVGQTVTYTLNLFIPTTVNTANNFLNRVYLSSNTPDPNPNPNPNPNNGFGQQVAEGAIAACPNYVTVNTTLYTPEELVKDVLVGMDCALISNIQHQGYANANGNPSGMGYFHANNSDFPLKEGIILRCGPAQASQGPYNGGAGLPMVPDVASGLPDAQLQAISTANGQPSTVSDVTFLQFDFTPINDYMSFNFLFSSNEYGVFQCSFADVFAFILTDLTTGVETNIALIPGTNVPVSVTNIRDQQYNGSCASSYVEFFGQMNGPGDPINMIGQAVVMQASSPVVPCRKYRIKLAIGDYLDMALDSAVFLEAGSFDIGSVDLGNDYVIEQGTAICPEDVVILSSGLDEIEDGCDITYSYQWYYNGAIIPGATAPTYEVPDGEGGFYELYTHILIAGDVTDVECDLNPAGVVVEFYPPLPAGQPDDLTTCNGVFNLEEVYDVLYGEELTSGDVTISFHLSMQDLEDWWNLEWNPPYPQLSAYTAISSPQTIYVRVQDQNSDCFVVRSFNLITEDCQFEAPEDILLCDNDQDGVEEIGLGALLVDLQNQFPDQNYEFAFYESESDANNGLNPLGTLFNAPIGSTTLWVRADNLDLPDEEPVFDFFVITINPVPQIEPNLTPIEVCDTNNDGFAAFNLTSAIAEVTGGDNTMNVFFYMTPEAALAGEGHITTISNFTNTVADLQTLYIRAVFAGQDCPSYSTVTLIVHPKPIIPSLTNYELCDDNEDGFMEFDLTSKSAEIIDGADAVLTYHLTLADAQNGENEINNLVNFTNQTVNQQTIYVRLENAFGCFDVSQFNIIVRPLPEVFTLEPLYVCNDGVNPMVAPFMLTDRSNAASGGVLGTTVTYHQTIAEAEDNLNALPSPYMGTNNQIVVVRAESQYGCVSYMTLTLMIVDAPVDPVLDPLEYCDPNSDGIGIFDLTSVEPLIVNANISPVTISFHGTYDDAFYDANNLTINNDITAFVNTEWYNQTIYIRIEGVTECFTIAELQLIVHDLPQITDPEPFEMCDDDYDGFVAFDLSSINEEVLGTLNPLTHEVSYFTTESDAHNNTNEIGNITTYTNQIIHEDTVWVRVDDLSTGCHDVTELILIVNPLPVVAMPEVPEYRLCDEDGDGFVEFDLQTQIAGIINGQAGLTVTFHDTYEDAELDQNPYPYLHTNNQAFVEAVFVRVETEKGCYVITIMDLIADPLPTLTIPSDPVVSCEGDNDGYSVFNLEELVEDMLNGADPTEFVVNFYETYINAEEGQNPISPLSAYFNTTPFIQTIYVEVTNTVSGCSAIYPLTLTVEGAPQLPVDAMNLLPEIELCDDNFDGITYFDFTEQTNYIMAAQEDTTNLVVTYHLTEENAVNGTLAIMTPNHYPNMTTPQTIWVRLENTETECFDTASFEIIVNVPLEIPENLQLTVCDADSDGTVIFNLTNMNPVILSNASNPNNYQVDFFFTLADAQNDTNVIQDPENLSNQDLGGGGVYTIYVRVIDLVTGCESYRSMTIRRAPMPNPMTANIVPLELCDAVTEDDLMEEFDLTSYEGYIRNGDNNLIFTYHLSEEEAWNDENAIPTPEAYFTASTTIYIRIANQPNADQSCTTVVELEVVVNPLPTVAQNYYAICNENSTGFEAFDLNGFTPTLLGPTQNPADFLVEYYLTLADAENQTNPINQGVPFENTTQGSQTIYVHIYNMITECERVAAFTLYAEEAAVANVVQDIRLCDYDGTNDGILELNLNEHWQDDVLGGQDPMQFAVTYHFTEEDAHNDVNAIVNPEAYSNTDSPYSQMIYIRVENTNTLSPCYDVTMAQILIEGLATPVITSDYTYICVDFDTKEVVRSVILDSNVTDPNYTFTWYHNGTEITGATEHTYTIDQFGGEGDYYVIATSTDPYFGCISDPSNTITIGRSGPATVVEILPTNAFADQQDIIVTVDGYGEYLYQLDNGPLQSTGHFVNVSPGAHVITVYDVLPGDGDVDDYNNCDAIPVENVSVVNYPHYFTPNGDGYHDRWNITGLNVYHNAEIYIFDRYGKLLKQLNPTGEGWDGTFNGTPLPASDYWFKVVYDEPTTDSEGNTTTRRKEFKAHFSIKR